MSQLDILIGADPENFIMQDGVFKSAYGLIPGDKETPFPVKNGAVQVDGMALEFNIDPAATEEEFVYNVNSVLSQLKEMVPEYRVLAVPVATFDPDYMKAQPEKATELGCTPDYNAYTHMENERPNGAVNFRTGAGHIHIGWTNKASIYSDDHLALCELVVKQMDVLLGIPSLLFDDSVQRRELYGKAGAYRPKSYGVEYRVLSNVWVGSESLTRWVYRTTLKAMRELEAGNHIFEQVENVQHIINTSDVEAAKEICLKLGLEIPEV